MRDWFVGVEQEGEERARLGAGRVFLFFSCLDANLSYLPLPLPSRPHSEVLPSRSRASHAAPRTRPHRRNCPAPSGGTSARPFRLLGASTVLMSTPFGISFSTLLSRAQAASRAEDAPWQLTRTRLTRRQVLRETKRGSARPWRLEKKAKSEHVFLFFLIARSLSLVHFFLFSRRRRSLAIDPPLSPTRETARLYFPSAASLSTPADYRRAPRFQASDTSFAHLFSRQGKRSRNKRHCLFY